MIGDGGKSCQPGKTNELLHALYEKGALLWAPFERDTLLLIPLSLHAVATTELINLSGSIHNLLFSGIEGMALRADFNLKFRLGKGRTRGEAAAAATGDFNVMVIRMDACFHLGVLDRTLKNAPEKGTRFYNLADLRAMGEKKRF